MTAPISNGPTTHGYTTMRDATTISRFPIRITPQGELFRAYPTRNEQSTRTTGLARTHETTCNYPPHPNREKTRPTTAPWHPRAKKFAQQQPRLGQTAKTLAQRAQKHRKPAIFAEQGELFRSSPVEWCNRFVSFGVGYALSWSGGSSCPVGWGVSRDLVRMSRLR